MRSSACFSCFVLNIKHIFSWLPLNHLSHCLAHTECKIAILDPERADLLQPVAGQLLQTSIIKSFLVFDLSQPRKSENFMPSLEEILENYQDDQIFLPKTFIDPEDNATIIFTSGT
jgi:long-subunit acyl-CoA synthetase (AMP-forming)